MRLKELGAGRNFTDEGPKSNTLPIQIALTLVDTSGGMMSVGLWFRILLLLGGCHKEGRIRISRHDPASLKHRKEEGRIAEDVVLNIGI